MSGGKKKAKFFLKKISLTNGLNSYLGEVIHKLSTVNGLTVLVRCSQCMVFTRIYFRSMLLKGDVSVLCIHMLRSKGLNYKSLGKVKIADFLG